MKPAKSILDKTFVYRDSANTSVSDTWRRFGWAPKESAVPLGKEAPDSDFRALKDAPSGQAGHLAAAALHEVQLVQHYEEYIAASWKPKERTTPQDAAIRALKGSP